MELFVHVNTSFVYQGISPKVARKALQTAINVVRTVEGTGIIYYKVSGKDEDQGTISFVKGHEVAREGKNTRIR